MIQTAVSRGTGDIEEDPHAVRSELDGGNDRKNAPLRK
jgi:hypothetical protein